MGLPVRAVHGFSEGEPAGPVPLVICLWPEEWATCLRLLPGVNRMFLGAPSRQPGSARAAAATFGTEGDRPPIPGLLLLGSGLWIWAAGGGGKRGSGDSAAFLRGPGPARPGGEAALGNHTRGAGVGGGEA